MRIVGWTATAGTFRDVDRNRRASSTQLSSQLKSLVGRQVARYGVRFDNKRNCLLKDDEVTVGAESVGSRWIGHDVTIRAAVTPPSLAIDLPLLS
jgi:hypothetical protein